MPVAQPEAGDLRIATILFADVWVYRDERDAGGGDVADIMNMVFDRLTDVIVGEGGTIDKYIQVTASWPSLVHPFLRRRWRAGGSGWAADAGGPGRAG